MENPELYSTKARHSRGSLPWQTQKWETMAWIHFSIYIAIDGNTYLRSIATTLPSFAHFSDFYPGQSVGAKGLAARANSVAILFRFG